ncbi:MAG: hypothetical protein M1819_005954 [Sarea resinae]|nr:MAG: hypothetical protein M1819_005954 [Sarea resinae]
MSDGESAISGPPGYPKIILFGDSLTERSFESVNNGFGKVLTAYYAGWADGFPGQFRYNSTWLRNFFMGIIGTLESMNSCPPLFITVFLGANDACLPPTSAHVPLPEFEANLRYYVDTILSHPMTKGTKVILITPPPIEVHPFRSETADNPSVQESLIRSVKTGRGYQTYMSKKLYAEKVMGIAKSYQEQTDLVAGLDFWTALVNFGHENGKRSESGPSEIDDEILPGSGLPGATSFGRAVLVDGLHLGPLGYKVLSRELLALITEKWPELQKEALPLQTQSLEDDCQTHGASAEVRKVDER